MAYNKTSSTISSGGFSGLASINTTAGATGYSAKKDTNLAVNSVDAEVVVTVVTPSGYTPSASTFVAVFAVGSNDGTTWPDGMTPQTASASLNLSANGNNMVFLGTIPCTAASGTFVSKPMSIAAAFGGTLPKHWAVAIQNNLPATYSITSGTISCNESYYN